MANSDDVLERERKERLALIQMALGKASVAFMRQSSDVVMPVEALLETASLLEEIWAAEVRELRDKLDSEASHRLSLCADNERFIAEVRELHRDRARLEDLAGRRAVVLAFFRSVIHCREPWTDKCRLEYDAAMGGGEG